jgi:hypothetical protein
LAREGISLPPSSRRDAALQRMTSSFRCEMPDEVGGYFGRLRTRLVPEYLLLAAGFQYISPLRAVIETPTFQRQAEKSGRKPSALRS